MKTSSFFSALVVTPIAAGGLIGAQEAAPAQLSDYLPCNGSLQRGVVVRIQLDESFAPLHKEALRKLSALPEDKRTAIVKATPANTIIGFTPDLWKDKAEYDQYAAAWKKTKIVPVAEVAMGFNDEGKGEWSVTAVTRTPQGTMPMTIANLRYSEETKTWSSNNGVLKPTNYTAESGNAYGAQTGTEWTLNKEDAMSQLNETMRLSKSTDGRYIYVMYGLTEISSVTHAPVANHGYIIRFEVPTAKANAGKPGQK